MSKVKIITSATDTVCNCGSWLKHWEKFSGQTTTFCIEKLCTGQDLVGAHIQKANSEDNSCYIIPLCINHNHSKEVIEVFDNYKFVLANKKETCEKD